MTESKSNTWRQVLQGIAALLALIAIAATAVYGLSRVLSGSVGGALAGGIVALTVAVVSKAFEHRQLRDTAIAEKKRDVYRRLLAPWERMMIDIKAGKETDAVVAGVDLAAVYASAFDAVLYGSDLVVQRYVEFRTPDASRDGVDAMRAMAALLVAMREDVTGKKTALSTEAVLGTFVNFTDDERLKLRLRDHLAKSPEAQRKLADALKETAATRSSSKG